MTEVLEKYLRQKDLWNLLYPKIYQDVGAYTSPKMAALAIGSWMIEIQIQGLARASSASRLGIALVSELIAKRMPMFFIASDMLQAVTKTDMDEPVEWLTMKLPYETAILMLPENNNIGLPEEKLHFIVYGRHGIGTHSLPGIPPFHVGNKGFIIAALYTHPADPGLHWYLAHLVDTYSPKTRLHHLFGDGEIPTLVTSGHAKIRDGKWSIDEPLNTTEANVLEDIGTVTFGTLLALLARPELMTRGRLEHRRPAKKGPTEIWSPNVIGKHYRLPQPAYQGGTHASPRMHWRRGHFRSQPYGPQHTLRKQIWLEPVLIGAGEK